MWALGAAPGAAARAVGAMTAESLQPRFLFYFILTAIFLLNFSSFTGFLFYSQGWFSYFVHLLLCFLHVVPGHLTS
jgi:hypothetical protein